VQDFLELSEAEIRELIHELGVYQVELETQNEELRQAQLELQQARDRYAELFELAPVGYFTLDERGMIEAVNLAGCELLGERGASWSAAPSPAFSPKNRPMPFTATCGRSSGNAAGRCASWPWTAPRPMKNT
jgi:PAS domain-containing protein